MIEINEFLDFVQSEKALADASCEAYRRDLEQFSDYLTVHRISFQSLGAKEVRQYLATLRRRGLSERSLARKASVLRQLSKFMIREEIWTTNPTEFVRIRLKSKRLPRSFSLEEMESLIQAPSGKTPLEIRDRALFELWYATGCRISEVARLTVDAIDWKASVVRIIGKRNRVRYVPLHQEAIDWCQKYRVIRHEWIRRQGLKESNIFFLSRRGTGFTRQFIWYLFKKYAKRANITRNAWPHMIRHSFATHVLKGGADLRTVQELLGHRSIATTEIYTHLDVEDLKIAQSKYHPRN